MEDDANDHVDNVAVGEDFRKPEAGNPTQIHGVFLKTYLVVVSSTA